MFKGLNFFHDRIISRELRPSSSPGWNPCYFNLACTLKGKVYINITALKTIWKKNEVGKVKVKVKFTLEQATKAQRGSR